MTGIRPVDIVVPCFKNAVLAKRLFSSLGECRRELLGLGCRIFAVNDSPADRDLDCVLEAARDALYPEVPVTIIRNERNLGFVKSVNKAAAHAIERGRHLLLLNSDTIVFPGAIQELVRVAHQDEMIGFVSPRSNNATICSLPHQEQFHKLPPEDAHAAFLELSRYLPDYHYVPTAVGFCLFIKAEILAEFGAFDEAYGQGYNEENDLIMRANRCGYRAALANYAYVYHVGEASFRISGTPAAAHEARNAALLASRYPEYPAAVNRYLASAHFQAERMLTALLPFSDGRLDLVFDFSSIGTYHCGTFEVARRILDHAIKRWRDRFHIHVMVSEEVKRFHHLDEMPGLLFVTPETEKVFAVAFRVGQPFEYSTLVRMSRVGVVNVYVMQDTVAFDSMYLDGTDLHGLWNLTLGHADAIIYISEFVRRQFGRRFRKRPGLVERVVYHSLDPADYRSGESSEPGDYILVIGNAFAHKWVVPTVNALAAAFPIEKVVALGVKEDLARNVVCYASGNLADAEIDDLYRKAKFILYPSLNEGFGLPVVKGLAYHKPVFARTLPVMHELRERVVGRENLHLYSTTEELIECLKSGFPVWQAAAGGAQKELHGWDQAADGIRSLLEQALAAHSFTDVLAPRLERMRPAANNSGAELFRELSVRIEEREKQVAGIYNSWSWRITAPCRLVLGWCLKARQALLVNRGSAREAGGGSRETIPAPALTHQAPARAR